jgi:DNA invertase Pin-like site-specific DNA recombinase
MELTPREVVIRRQLKHRSFLTFFQKLPTSIQDIRLIPIPQGWYATCWPGLTDLLDVLKDLHAKEVDIFLHQQGLDTSTPSGRAMYQMLGVFAEFERAMIRERVMAGLARARADGIKLGRKSLEDADAKKVRAIRALLSEGAGVRRIARDLRVGVGTVLRIPASAKVFHHVR